MCNFFSAIVTKDGLDVLWSEYSDFHSYLIKHFGLKDDGKKDFAKIEFLPCYNRFADVDAYTLRLDEDEYAKPEWWTDEVADTVRAKCRAIIRAAIVPAGERRFALGGLHILVDAAIEAHYAKVFACGSSEATLYESSKATLYESSKATLYGSSEATLCDSSKATLYGSSKATLCDSSKATLYGSSEIIDKRTVEEVK